MRARAVRPLIPLLAIALIPVACVLSTEPVITERDAIFDPRLLGSWEVLADSDRVTVTRGRGLAYHITYSDRKGEAERFTAYLGRLGDRMVLDISPADSSVNVPAGDLFVPHHLLLGIDIRDREIGVALLEPDSVRAAVKVGRIPGAHEVSWNRVVLEGGTSELRTLLAGYIARPGVFATEGIWTRVGATGGR